MHLLYRSIEDGEIWSPASKVHLSVQRLLTSLGLRMRSSSRDKGILEKFFEEFGVPIGMSWKRALGPNLADGEHPCLRIRQLQVGDPTALVLMLDTFNEVLLQSFSAAHPTLCTPYRAAAGKKAHPDMGNWLNHPVLATILTCGVPWFQRVHSARVSGDLAHARSKKGNPTKPVAHKTADTLLRSSKVAWRELLTEWKKLF
jgi:hypothetical protein